MGPKVISLHGEIWKTADFLEVESAIGSVKALGLLRSFVARLDDVSCTLRLDKPSGHQIKMIAHDLRGISGQLGFQALARFCARIMTADDINPIPKQFGTWLDLIQSSIRIAESYCAANATPRTAVTR